MWTRLSCELDLNLFYLPGSREFAVASGKFYSPLILNASAYIVQNESLFELISCKRTHEPDRSCAFSVLSMCALHRNLTHYSHNSWLMCCEKSSRPWLCKKMTIVKCNDLKSINYWLQQKKKQTVLNPANVFSN